MKVDKKNIGAPRQQQKQQQQSIQILFLFQIVYDKEPEVLLSYNSSTHVQKLESNANPTHKVNLLHKEN